MRVQVPSGFDDSALNFRNAISFIYYTYILCILCIGIYNLIKTQRETGNSVFMPLQIEYTK